MTSLSHDDNDFDFDKLEIELNAAVAADEKYQRENDAKFRAVQQRVASYEEFKDIVAASHLKPLDKGDKIKSRFQQPWNVIATKQNGDVVTDYMPLTQNKDSVKIPATSLVFIREWRHVHKTESKRHQFLLAVGAQKLAAIFKGEIGFGLLGDFLIVMATCMKREELLDIIDILEQLSTTNRFSLSVQFLSKQEQEACVKLFKNLESERSDCTEVLDRLEKLKQKYEVKE